MKFKIFLLAFLFLIANSCKSPKTNRFRETIIQKERDAFQIILGKNGSETKKLDHLAKDDYKGAIAAVDLQTREFDELIKSIEILSTDNIQEGKPLKTAAINYYKSLKELHFFDRKEIEKQESISKLNENDQIIAQDQLIELARKKKSLYSKVYRNEHLLNASLDKFDAVNGY